MYACTRGCCCCCFPLVSKASSAWSAHRHPRRQQDISHNRSSPTKNRSITSNASPGTHKKRYQTKSSLHYPHLRDAALVTPWHHSSTCLPQQHSWPCSALFAPPFPKGCDGNLVLFFLFCLVCFVLLQTLSMNASYRFRCCGFVAREGLIIP